MKIVLIDDELVLLEYLEKTVCEIAPNDEITAFHSPGTLLKHVMNNGADVVFLDVRMPGMDGIQLAKELISVNPNINLIFTTGYDAYREEAMDMFASGYIKKPITKEKIKAQLEHLRYPVDSVEFTKYYARTFGKFALSADGLTVKFHRKRSEELLAYLIYKNGALVTREELIEKVLEDAEQTVESQNLLNVLINTLKKDLAVANAESLLVKEHGCLAVCKDHLKSDYYEYLGGRKSLYQGEFMEQYAWGEEFKNNI